MNKPLKIYMLESNLNYDSNGFLILYKLLCSDGIHTKGINEEKAIYATTNIESTKEIYKEIIKGQNSFFTGFGYNSEMLLPDRMFVQHFIIDIPEDASVEEINNIKNNIKKLYDEVFGLAKIIYIYHENNTCKHIHVIIPTTSCFTMHSNVRMFNPSSFAKDKIIPKINELNGDDVILLDFKAITFPANEYNAIEFYNTFLQTPINPLLSFPKNEEIDKYVRDYEEAQTFIDSECERQSIEFAEKYMNSDLLNFIPDYNGIHFKGLAPLKEQGDRLEKLYGKKIEIVHPSDTPSIKL